MNEALPTDGPPLDLCEDRELTQALARLGSILSDPLRARVVATLLAVERCTPAVMVEILRAKPGDVLTAVTRLAAEGAVDAQGEPISDLLDAPVTLKRSLHEALPATVRDLLTSQTGEMRA